MPSEQRVDKRRKHRALRRDQETAQNQHHEDKRQQPQLLSHLQEGPQLDQKGESRSHVSKLVLEGLTGWTGRLPRDPIGGRSSLAKP